MFHDGLSVEDYGIRNHRALHAHEFVRRITEAHRMFPFLVKTSVGVSTTSVKPKVRTSAACVWRIADFRHKSAIRHTQVRSAGPAAATRTRCAKSHATQALESCAPAPAPGAQPVSPLTPRYNPAGGGEGAASRTSRDSTLHFGAQRAAFSGDQVSDQSVGFFLSALIVFLADELLDRNAGGLRQPERID